MIICKCWAKTYMVARPTSSMKKGWLYRTSYDEKNHEITLVKIQYWWSSRDDPDQGKIQIQRWSSRDDLDRGMIQIQEWCYRWSRSSDDPDLAVMIQIKWWSISSDDPDPVMIQIQWWWSRSSDDLDPKMKMTWRWKGIDDVLDDT